MRQRYAIATNFPIDVHVVGFYTGVKIIESKPWKDGTALLVEGEIGVCLKLCAYLMDEQNITGMTIAKAPR